ncbi:MAG: hypothetical protein WC393_00010 [Candidatus Nanoarchaeia archaeon]|jgi:hypothetical protein
MADGEEIQYKSEIEKLKEDLIKIDEPPIDMSKHIEILVDSLNKMQELMNNKDINKKDFEDNLINAKKAGVQVNLAFAVDIAIKALEEKINSITDAEAKKKTQDYFKKNLPFIGIFKDLEKPLETEVKEIKNSFYKNKENHPVQFYELATSLKEFPNLPNINAEFLDLEGMAFNNKKDQIKKMLEGLDKVSTIITMNLKRFLDEKLDPTKIKEMFKQTTGKDIIEIFKDTKGIIEPEKFKAEFNQTNESMKKIAETIENYKDVSHKPIYKKLLNFYWNSMIFYETMENELKLQEETKGLASMIEGLGDDFAKTYEGYAKLYNPDELDKISNYLDKKSSLFTEIYYVNYLNILKNYQKILDAIENKEKKTGIKMLILKIVNAELNNDQEGQKLQEEIQGAKELINAFSNIDSDNNDKIKKFIIPPNAEFETIEKDINKRLGKIVLIDEKSIQLFNLVDDMQKEIIQDVNVFIQQIKNVWEKNKGSLQINDMKLIKENYARLIKSLKSINDIYHNQIIKNYKQNLDSMNKFIDNFDLMYGLKNKVNVLDKNDNKEKDKEIRLIRFDFQENDLDRLIQNETMKKQEINAFFEKNENMDSLNKSLQILKGMK